MPETKYYSVTIIYILQRLTFHCCIYTFSCSIIQEMMLILWVMHMY